MRQKGFLFYDTTSFLSKKIPLYCLKGVLHQIVPFLLVHRRVQIDAQNAVTLFQRYTIPPFILS